MPTPDGTPPPRRAPGDRLPPWVRVATPWVAGSWVAARVLTGLSYLVANWLAPHVDLPFGRLHLDQRLISWDGAYYRVIAEQGYEHVPREVVRFFPLYPLVSRYLAPLFGGRDDIALVVVANVAALVAMYLLWRLITLLGFDDGVAARGVVLTAVFPAAMCLVFAYAEAPFLVALFAAAILLHRDRPLPAVVPLVVVGLLRPTGVMVAGAVAVLAVTAFLAARRTEERMPLGWVASWSAAVVAPVVGLASYLWWLEATSGRGDAPLEVQRRLRAGFHEPLTRSLRALADVATGHFRDVYNLAFLVVLVAAVVVAVRRRLPVAWTVYLVVGLLVAMSANNIDSLGRYGMLLAPTVPIALGVLLDRRRWFVTAVVVSSIGFVWFTTVSILGLVVP